MSSNPVTARVKWFNSTKGFGFVAPSDGTPDAFLHVSVLSSSGLSELSDGSEVSCEIVQGQRGPQVARIVEVLHIAPASERRSFGDRDGGFGGGGDRFGGGDRYGGGGDRYGGGDRFGGGDRYGGGGGGDRFGGGGFRSAPRGPRPGAEPLAQPPADGETLLGTVKWFKPESGFGFIIADDGGKDVFIHKSVLRRCGLQSLDSDQRVRMTVQMAPKGREAVWIAPA